MAIYRGSGGSGDATGNVTVSEIETLRSEAAQSATEAEQSATNAAASEATVAASAAAAATSETNAEAAKIAAEAAQAAAELSETNAASSEANAATSETNSATSASNAATSETNAASSATAAATSATNAATSASDASDSAGVAALNATSASNSASSAATSASNAATSESNAATSETNAANSASAAATSASNAATSETNAATSASSASTSATNAATSETNAAASASSASTSASNAASSATAASASATAASTSETNAAASASAASTSETNAATSATNAASAQTAAETAQAAAELAYDNFDDRYLGAKASAPTLDNDGNALITGALYFDTVDDSMKVYNGSSWLDAYASLSGALLSVNNLSDLDNATTARTNLGLGTAATTASTDYATAAQGALADSAIQPNDSPSFGSISVTGTVDGRDIAADGSKLDGIESGATSDQTASEILTAIKTVDGAGSGLDADLLDGQNGTYYYSPANPPPSSTPSTLGAVGTYAMLVRTAAGSTISAGSTYAGSGLRYTGSQDFSNTSNLLYSNPSYGSAPAGTWRAMGHTTYRDSRFKPFTIFIRIS